MRLQGYDYTRAGLYFLTIVLQNRLRLFGQIENGKMFLNDAGKMVEKWYCEIENKFPDKRCREMVVMPDHFHCIIENMDIPGTNQDTRFSPRDAHAEASLRGRLCVRGRRKNVIRTENKKSTIFKNKYGLHNKKYRATIGDVMEWFKTMTTNEYIRGVKTNNWRRFDRKLWQRNYYDHIIRNVSEYKRIAAYIINNPAKGNDDKSQSE